MYVRDYVAVGGAVFTASTGGAGVVASTSKREWPARSARWQMLFSRARHQQARAATAMFTIQKLITENHCPATTAADGGGCDGGQWRIRGGRGDGGGGGAGGGGGGIAAAAAAREPRGGQPSHASTATSSHASHEPDALTSTAASELRSTPPSPSRLPWPSHTSCSAQSDPHRSAGGAPVSDAKASASLALDTVVPGTTSAAPEPAVACSSAASAAAK